MKDRRNRALPGQYPVQRSSNRRAFPRWAGHFELRCKIGMESVDGSPFEISEGGLSFEVNRPLPVGTELELEYRLQGSQDAWVKVRTIVRHADGNRVGVEFLNLKLADRLQIVDSIAKPASSGGRR